MAAAITVAITTEAADARAIDDGEANQATAWVNQSDTRTITTVNGRNARSNWARTDGPDERPHRQSARPRGADQAQAEDAESDGRVERHRNRRPAVEQGGRVQITQAKDQARRHDRQAQKSRPVESRLSRSERDQQGGQTRRLEGQGREQGHPAHGRQPEPFGRDLEEPAVNPQVGGQHILGQPEPDQSRDEPGRAHGNHFPPQAAGIAGHHQERDPQKQEPDRRIRGHRDIVGTDPRQRR